MNGPQTYTLLGADSKPYQSASKGQWGGHRDTRIYGRLDCPAALRAIAHGGYTQYRVFFADQATAIAAGYRPCATCCPDRYQEWKSNPAAAARTVSGQAGAMPPLAREHLSPPSRSKARLAHEQQAGSQTRRPAANRRCRRTENP
jgi:hypothetical protein